MDKPAELDRKRARLDEEKLQVEHDKELEAIKKQYMGCEKRPKKRVMKKRICFDWDKSDDTSTDSNDLYQNPHVARLLYGRGSWAGIDIHEQKKDRHWSEKVLHDMTPRDWRIFKEDFNISYKGSRVPHPIRNWNESNLSWELLKVVDRAGYKTPTPIQMASIPLGLQQRDVIGVAETGSGKTAAFLLPLLDYITRLPPMTGHNIEEGPYAVVMAPTRELAQQIEHETVKFARYLGIKVVCIVGGKSIDEQAFKIRQGCEVMIATPGRLIDCLERQYVVLNQCNYVVLDEADRMIDMGFEPQIVRVLDSMPSTNFKPGNEDEELDEKKIYRTTYMFSATMPPAIERLANKYLRNPVVVTTSTAGKPNLISQHVILVKESQKMVKLQELLDELGDQTVIVFVNTRKTADFISDHKANYRLTTLHGGKSKDQRNFVLEDFRNKRYNVLVATDLAGRGIDIPDLAHVINYDMAPDIETYTHRIGRTGRAGKKGIATTLLTLQDSHVFYDLMQMLIQSKSPVPPELSRHEASKYKPGSVPNRPPKITW